MGKNFKTKILKITIEDEKIVGKIGSNIEHLTELKLSDRNFKSKLKEELVRFYGNLINFDELFEMHLSFTEIFWNNQSCKIKFINL